MICKKISYNLNIFIIIVINFTSNFNKFINYLLFFRNLLKVKMIQK